MKRYHEKGITWTKRYKKKKCKRQGRNEKVAKSQERMMAKKKRKM